MVTDHEVRAEIHASEPQLSSCYGYWEQQENPLLWYLDYFHAIMFRAIRKSMIKLIIASYSEQQGNQCSSYLWHCIQSNKEINDKVNYSNMEIYAQFQAPIFWKLWIWAKFWDQTWKNKTATLINALIGSIFWNKDISCHHTIKRSQHTPNTFHFQDHEQCISWPSMCSTLRNKWSICGFRSWIFVNNCTL